MRDNSITKFSYKAFRNLKSRLGEFDAVVECNEIAIREFIKNANKEPDRDSYIKKLAEKHEVRVDTVNLQLFETRIRQYYILSVIQQSEQFFDEIKKEVKKNLELKWIDKKDGETDLDNVLLNLFGSVDNGINQISSETYFGYEYYRLIRNRFAHSEEKDDKRLKKMYQSVKSFEIEYNQRFHSYNCPNEYEKINFNDFLLCTNLIKNIGYTFCEKFKPNNETLAKLIYELEVTDEETTKKIRPIKNIMKLKNDNTRYFNAIKNLLNSHYGKINDIDTKEIIEYLKAF